MPAARRNSRCAARMSRVADQPASVAVGEGAAVVGIGIGDAVVGTGTGLLVVGTGAGLLVVGAGAAVVGAAAEAFGVADGFAELRVPAGVVVSASAPAVAPGPQVTLYAAGLDDSTTGLV